MGAESGRESDVNGGQKSVNADLHGQLRGVIEREGNSQSKGKALERIARENGMEFRKVPAEDRQYSLKKGKKKARPRRAFKHDPELNPGRIAPRRSWRPRRPSEAC